MNKRQRKKETTKNPSKKDYIRYWKKAYRTIKEKLTTELSKSDTHIDMLCDATKNLIEQKNKNMILKSDCIRYQFEVDKLNLENEKLKLQLEETRLSWWRRLVG